MKNLRNAALSVLLAFFFFLPALAQNSALSKPVNAVIDNYLALKNVLVTGDGTLAAAKSKLLLASVNEVPKTGLSTDQVTLLAKLEYDSRHISEVPRVAHQCEHFASLSNNLYKGSMKLIPLILLRCGFQYRDLLNESLAFHCFFGDLRRKCAHHFLGF